MTPLFRKFLGMHWIIFATMALLLAGGVYSIYAAVHFREGAQSDLVYKWREQINWIMVGAVAYFSAALVDYKWVKWVAPVMYLGSLGLMAALFTSRGVEVYGQLIGLKITGSLVIQPAQFAIASTILLMAVVLGESHKLFPWMRHYLVRFLVSGIVFGIPFGFMVKLGDVGSAMVIGPVAVVMLLVGNIPLRCLIVTALIAVTALPWVYYFKLKPYQKARIDVTLDLLQGKQVDIKGDGYALTNILIGVGSAGWTGKGLDTRDLPGGMKNMLQLGLLPKETAHNDFIYASICETFGFRGAASMLAAFMFLLIMCITVAFFARDSLGRLIVSGIIALLLAHVFEHAGMNIGLLPITGLPLPFVSYGGTFLIMNLFMMGLLQSVWIHRNKMLEEEAQKRPVISPRTAPRID
jgi:rod shape determining protein RodA